MSNQDLRNLHELHKIDLAIFEIKKRAGAMDPGRAIQAQIAKLTEFLELKSQELHTLASEQTDLELKQKSADERAKRINGEIYGGKVINPREIENLEKELKNIAEKKSATDDRLLELMEQIPPARERVDQAQAAIDVKKRELAEFQKLVMVERQKLEAEFKQASAARPAAEKLVPASMLVRYNAIKQKLGGVAMADAVKGTCGQCGMNLPTKSIELAKEGKVVTCEACHRILYASDGLI